MSKAETCGLLVVDVQGKLADLVFNSQAMVNNVCKLIKSCQVLSIPVVVLEQNPNGLGDTITDIVDSIEHFQPLKKYSFNALDEPTIKTHIHSLQKKCWLVAGIEAHVCIYQTVKGLLKEDLIVEVVADCISSRVASNIDLAITNLRLAGAHVTSLEMCIFEMLKSCKHEHFKQLLKIIK